MNKALFINTIKILTLLAAIAWCFSSCKENGEVAPYGKPANLNVVNADTAALNIYQNGARLNNVSSIAAGSQTGYMSVAWGTKTYQFKKAGATNYIVNSFPLTLDTTRYYSLFIAGETVDKIFLANDALPAFATNMAQIRFVNASPVLTNFDVTIGSLSFKNQAFKAITNYTAIAGGTITVTIYQAGTSTLISNNTITINVGGAYTLSTQGVPGGTGQNKFALLLTLNN